MKKNGTTDEHRRWSAEIYAAYAKAKKAQMLASIIGEGEMGDVEKNYLEFGKAFEAKFINQGKTEERTLDETLNIGWELLRLLPIHYFLKAKFYTNLLNQFLHSIIDRNKVLHLPISQCLNLRLQIFLAFC